MLKPLLGPPIPSMQLHYLIVAWSLSSTSDGPHSFQKGPTSKCYPPEKGCFFLGPRGYVSMSGIRWPPPITTKCPKAVRRKPLTTCLLLAKNPLFTPLRNKQPLLTHTHQFWLSCINPKIHKSFVFIIFFNWKPPCTHLWMSKLSTHIQLHPEDATKIPYFLLACLKLFEPLTIASHPV